ncbi:MAG: hypothetical protein ABUL60_34470 [Myxococcales bacterium]
MLLALCSMTGVARGAGPPMAEPFRLVWSSSAGCGDARNFLAELEGRTSLLREAQQDEHAITLIVETFRVAGGVRGQLTVRHPDGSLTMREVPGLDCREVESAMALIAALMVDPLAGSAVRATVKAPRFSPPPLPAAGPPPPLATWSWRMEQRLTAHTAIAPQLTWGQAAGVMLTADGWSMQPSVGLSAHMAHATTRASAGSAELEWLAGELAVCPLSLQPGERWDWRACGAFQLGRLRGIGFHTFDPAEKSIMWSSAGVTLQGRYQVLGPLWLGWEGEFIFPFSRERFFLDPEETLHRVPWWGLGFGVGLGLRFF